MPMDQRIRSENKIIWLGEIFKSAVCQNDFSILSKRHHGRIEVLLDAPVLRLQKLRRRLLFLFGYRGKFGEVAGNTLAVAEEVLESSSVECALVGENELNMRFKTPRCALDIDVFRCFFVNALEQAGMTCSQVFIVSIPQFLQVQLHAAGIHSEIPNHSALLPLTVVFPLHILVRDKRLDLLRSRLIERIRQVSGQREKRGISKFAIDIQPRPAGMKVTLKRPEAVPWVFRFSGLLLELMVFPGIITQRLKAEQRNAVSKPLVEKEVIFADALKRYERAVQQQILFIVEALLDLVQTLFTINVDTEKGAQQRLANEKLLLLGDTQSIPLLFRLRPGVILRYGANDCPAQGSFTITCG